MYKSQPQKMNKKNQKTSSNSEILSQLRHSKSIAQVSEFLHDLELALSSCSKYDFLQDLIEFGSDYQLPASKLSALKQESHLVSACTSTVYMRLSVKNGLIHIEGFADALIIKGFVKIIVESLQNTAVTDWQENKSHLLTFMKRTGIDQSFLATRANSFANIIEFCEQKLHIVQH